MPHDETPVVLERIEVTLTQVARDVSRINGRLDTAEQDITTLKVRDGYVAGAAAILVTVWSAILAWIFGRT